MLVLINAHRHYIVINIDNPAFHLEGGALALHIIFDDACGEL